MSFCHQSYFFTDLCMLENEHLLKLPEFRALIPKWFLALFGSLRAKDRKLAILDALDLMMQGTYGQYNHAYILLAFEDFFSDVDEMCSFHLENFLTDFVDTKKLHESVLIMTRSGAGQPY